ncbi:glutamate-5-semialdehyde dehydrogenase [Clostridium pascui]|uniref:glutamate-5-semialdehyde dehydrogenase n=1 Tax=Clostridium pascui TaxID=46609 RepID=UPI0019581B19|nr:glutamate-5-semialdehyde dehydrogenase [Clostridium pascui]MBM7868810.1 glutamate-5-semialdehyde dehydrogenase [Clostridium pascui]
MENLQEYILGIGAKAKEASRKLSSLDTNSKNNALLSMAEALKNNALEIIEANKIDLRLGEEKGLNKSLLDRLLINEQRIDAMAEGLRQVSELPDPIGEIITAWKRPNGITIGQKRVPLGVIGIIYEARPNVTVDAAALCLKSGNAVILRGGSEAINTNMAIAKILRNSLISCNLSPDFIQLVEVTDREIVNIMLKLNQYIDVLIPRGGAGLIQTVVKNATVPVIETGVGNCHVFVDSSADLTMAENIIVNGKTQRPAVCNAIETILIHKDAAEEFVPKITSTLNKLGVELRVCEKAKEIIDANNINANVKPATSEDWDREYLDLILAVKVVDCLEEAMEHIYNHGTKHSECIVTNDYKNSQIFLETIDSAAVYVNASTRFTDGFEFGFGAEIGISTQKLHARGPMGLPQLTTIKYIISGSGQIR